MGGLLLKPSSAFAESKVMSDDPFDMSALEQNTARKSPTAVTDFRAPANMKKKGKALGDPGKSRSVTGATIGTGGLIFLFLLLRFGLRLYLGN